MNRRSARRDERGVATTEAVLVTPVLLFLTMLVVQFGLWFHAQHVAQAAAEEGVRTARAFAGTGVAGQRRANEFLDQAGSRIVLERTVDVTRTADLATVEVRGTSVAVVPGFHLPIHARATSPTERFRSDTP